MGIIKSLEHKFHEYTNGMNKKVMGNEFIRGIRPFVSFVFKYFVLIMYTVVLHQSAVGAELECKGCHQKIYDEISGSTYQHYDFIQRECNVCHSSRGSVGLRTSVSENLNVHRINLENYADEHLVILNNLSMGSIYKVRISLNEKKGRKKESDWLIFNPASISEFWIDDKTPPSVSMVEVRKIEISVFVNGEISWETDELSDSRVEYGTTEGYGYSSYSAIYTKKHILKLNNLEHNRIYHYRVISSDSFENKVISRDYTFNTSNAFNYDYTTNAQREDIIRPDFKDIKILGVKTKKDLKSDIAIYFSTSSEVSSAVEYTEKKEAGKGAGLITGEKPHSEIILKNRKESGIDACVTCHTQGASHPVGVTSKGNIRIPNSLPTAEGNIMTCVTCHTPHGGKAKYLARIDFKMDICVLCHIDRL